MSFGHTAKWRAVPIGYIAAIASTLILYLVYVQNFSAIGGFSEFFSLKRAGFQTALGSGIYKLEEDPKRIDFNTFFISEDFIPDYTQYELHITPLPTAPIIGYVMNKLNVLLTFFVALITILGLSVDPTGVCFLIAAVLLTISCLFDLFEIVFGMYLYSSEMLLNAVPELSVLCKKAPRCRGVFKEFNWPVDFLIAAGLVLPEIMIKSWIVELLCTCFNLSCVKGNYFAGVEPKSYATWPKVVNERRQNGLFGTGFGTSFLLDRSDNRGARKLIKMQEERDKQLDRERQLRATQIEAARTKRLDRLQGNEQMIKQELGLADMTELERVRQQLIGDHTGDLETKVQGDIEGKYGTG